MINTASLKLSATAIRLIVIGAALIVLALGVRWWLSERDERRALEATSAQQTRTAGAVAAIGEDLGAQTDAQGDAVQRVVETRVIYQTQMEKLADEDQTVADARARPVPLGMRYLACQRRAARDGLGAREAGCDRFVEGPRADGSGQAP